MSSRKSDHQVVLVTGGAGFIGSHLVTALLNRPVRQVRVLDNFATGKKENLAHLADDPRLVVLNDSVVDSRAAARACADVDLVFHLACLGVRHSLRFGLENHRVNAEGTLVILEAARRAQVRRFVHVSSSEVYGTAQFIPMNEEHPTRPTTIYGAGKLAGESYARAYHQTYNFPTIVVRPFNNFGSRSHFEGDSGEVIPRFIVRALHGRPPVIFGDGEQTRDFIHVHDTVRGLLRIAEESACVGGTFNLGRGTEISVTELARVILELTGRTDLQPIYQPAGPGDVRRLCADTSKVRTMLGLFPLVSFRQGLVELIDWIQAQGDRLPDCEEEEPNRKRVAA